jgi:hypothetical protein
MGMMPLAAVLGEESSAYTASLTTPPSSVLSARTAVGRPSTGDIGTVGSPKHDLGDNHRDA